MITWEDFLKVEFRVGTVIEAAVLEGARKPAYRLTIDFGEALGKKHSSAQLTVRYQPGQLIGRQVLCVANLPPKKVAGFTSEVLVTGFADEAGGVVLCGPEQPVPNGTQLF